MTKIIINGRFLIHRVTGVERFARELIIELDKVIKPGEIEMAIPPEAKDVPMYKNIAVKRVGKLHNQAWEHISFPKYVHGQHGISLNLCNVAPLVSPGITCIHDVKVKATPQYFSKKFLAWYNLLLSNETRRCRALITVSEFSKREICKYFGVQPSKITVIPNGWQHYKRIGYDDDALNKYGLQKKKYYFSMCSLEPNKNFRWIAEVACQHPEMIFAISGSINKTVFANGLGFECPDNMKLLGYVSDEEAKSLMKNCEAFLFPTFYEGFGIPPLEAIVAGARSVIVSDTEVMHEVLGEVANYVDPNQPKLPSKSLRIISEQQKIEVLSKFSWKDSASKLLNLLRSM